MGKVVRFSDFKKYFEELPITDQSELGTVLDANILIAISYEPKKYHTRVLDFLSKEIYSRGFKCFTTVNTTMEYLEFHRRLLMTEGLIDSIDQFAEAKLSNNKKKAIRSRLTPLRHREKHHKADAIFYDREIKAIREDFARSGMTGILGWRALSEKFVKGALAEEYSNLKGLNIGYVSINNEDQAEYFHKEMKWEDAIDICSTTCSGFSDTMILNALMCTKFHFAVSLDKDMAYATLADDNLKDVVMPDELIDGDSVLSKIIS